MPLMICAPNTTNGKKTESLAELVDIYPTVCEIAGLKIPEHVEGVSMMPLLKDPTRSWKRAAFTIWFGSRSMRTERYRLTRYDQRTVNGSRDQLPGTGKWELYDYQTDPAGDVNLADDPKYKPLLHRLMKMMDAGWEAARPDRL